MKCEVVQAESSEVLIKMEGRGKGGGKSSVGIYSQNRLLYVGTHSLAAVRAALTHSYSKHMQARCTWVKATPHGTPRPRDPGLRVSKGRQAQSRISRKDRKNKPLISKNWLPDCLISRGLNSLSCVPLGTLWLQQGMSPMKG